MSLDNIVDAIPEEPNELSEQERDNLYIYLTRNDTNLDNVEKLLNLCKTNNAKLVSVSGNKRRKISDFEGDTGDNGSLAKAFMMLVTNYPPSSSGVDTMICPVSFMQVEMMFGTLWMLGSRRNIAERLFLSSLQSLLDAGINEVNANIMSFVGETTQGNDISHRLVHIRTNVPEEEEAEEGKNLLYPFTSSTLRGPSNKPSVVQNDNEGVPYYSQIILEFASDYVAEGVINRLSEINKQVLLDFVKTSVDVNEYSSLRGIIFERLAHQKLLNGGD
ncbi:uncharacterized protein OCT59_019976 [Rhizophagus irregularis]|uniref:uncharacterized protein n=1 Tax=Rhizophagus irregularis TaxID=588596 RepID=UPI00332783DA|nr:hypothetical protein OCT59_019976 [Rhizophagus irregularis]